MLGGPLLPAASSAERGEKPLPRDLAMSSAPGGLALRRVVGYPNNCSAGRLARFPFLLTVALLGDGLLLLFSTRT